MTENQITRRHDILKAAAKRASDTHSRVSGNRQSKGERLQSRAEIGASVKKDAAATAYRGFCTEHGLKITWVF